MTNPRPEQLPEEDIPEAVVATRSGISIVWLIPVIAALIGGWLAWKAYSEQGPTITISFKSAEGLEAGKTKIRYKDVEIGQVENIELSDDLSHQRCPPTAGWHHRASPRGGDPSAVSDGGPRHRLGPARAGAGGRLPRDHVRHAAGGERDRPPIAP